MTLHDVSNALYNISVGGYFNGEKFTKSRLYSYIKNAFRDEVRLPIPGRVIMEISLPDGRWFMSINHYNDKPDGYDWWIPDTREQSDGLINQLITAYLNQ